MLLRIRSIQERRLWEDVSWQDKSASFWKELAAALKDHPAVVGYNILNEPAPERVEPTGDDVYRPNSLFQVLKSGLEH